jgi:hypothetical protein
MTIFPLKLRLKKQPTYKKQVKELLEMSESLARIINHIARMQSAMLPMDAEKINTAVTENLSIDGDLLLCKLAGFAVVKEGGID